MRGGSFDSAAARRDRRGVRCSGRASRCGSRSSARSGSTPATRTPENLRPARCGAPLSQPRVCRSAAPTGICTRLFAGRVRAVCASVDSCNQTSQNKKRRSPGPHLRILDSGVLRSGLCGCISVMYSCRHLGHQIGRFSASVSGRTRRSFLLHDGQMIHPPFAGFSISDFTPMHKPFSIII